MTLLTGLEMTEKPIDIVVEQAARTGLPIWIRLFKLALWVLLPAGLLVGAALLFGHVSRLPRTVLRAHAGGVMSMAYSPDGGLLASGGQDGRVRLWDARTAKERGTLEGHERRVAAVAFSPDGTLLASGGFDRTIRIWDLSTGRACRTLSPGRGQVHALAFSPDGRLLAVATDGVLAEDHEGPPADPADSVYQNPGAVDVWAVSNGAHVARLAGGSGWSVSLAFSPDGRTLATGARPPIMPTAPDEARLYDTTDWQPRRVLPQRAGVLALAFAPDGRTLAVGGWASTVRLFDLTTDEEKSALPPQGRWVTSLAISPDGRWLASGSNDRTVRVWDLQAGLEQSRRVAHEDWVMAVAFAPDGQRLASAGRDGAIKLWAVAQSPSAFDPMTWLQNSEVWAWVGFHVFIILMLAIDLGLFQRKAHAPTIREAAGWYILWVIFAVVFGAGVWFFKGDQKGQEFAAGYLIEQSLSVDNLFVFLVVFRYFAVPAHLQHRVLFWGIVGALIMRATFILVGAELLIHFHWTLYFFGGFLIYTGYKLMRAGEHEVHPERNILLRIARRIFRFVTSYESNGFFVRHAGKLHATPLFLVLLVIESTDVIFAVDSIPAILGVFEDPRQPDIFIAYTSNIFAILGLRSLFFLLAGFLGMFRFLNIGLSLVLAFVGVKMILAAAEWYKMDSLLSLAVIASILAASIVASLVAGPKPTRHDAAVSTSPPAPSVDGADHQASAAPASKSEPHAHP